MIGPDTINKHLMAMKCAENGKFIDLSLKEEISVKTFSCKGHEFQISDTFSQLNVKEVLYNFDSSDESIVEQNVEESRGKGFSIMLLCPSLESLGESLQSKVDYAFRDDTPDSNAHTWNLYDVIHEPKKVV